MTIWLREAASPEKLSALLSLGLVLYTGWHFTKAAFFRPESPFDWAPAERELLAAMPLRPRDLVTYQLASVTVTTILKAGLFTLLLLPDLRCVPLALMGLLMVMMVLEMLRMAVEIATWGMDRSAFLAYRAAVVAGLVAGGFAVGAVIVREDAFGGWTQAGERPVQRLLDILVQLDASVIGYAALPFKPFIDMTLADHMTIANAGMAAAALGTVMGLATAVIGLYAMTARRVANRERRNYRTDAAAHGLFAGSTRHEPGLALSAAFPPPLRRIPRWGGAGPLAWRQLVGARRRWGSLLTAMIAPAVIACATCFVIADPHIAFLVTTGTLAFYTFLLLPTAIRFDFRRDLDRLATLKGLPISPVAAAIGQTLAPVLITTLFQCGVLIFVVVARLLPLNHLFMAMLVMTPLNLLVFGLENLIYLLYPYRVRQEGLEIFVRTMLVFTGKGLLFTVGLGAISAWGFAAAALTREISALTGRAINSYAVFSAGVIAGPSILAAIVLYGLYRTYRNMDPIEDIPR